MPRQRYKFPFSVFFFFFAFNGPMNAVHPCYMLYSEWHFHAYIICISAMSGEMANKNAIN